MTRGASPKQLDLEPLASTTMESPVGTLVLAASASGLRAVLWLDEPAGRVPLRGTAATAPGATAPPGAPATLAGTGAAGQDAASPDAERILADAVRQLGEYFAGTRRTFDLPLDPVGTEFQKRAWQVLRAIPYGETISYGEQAARLGDPKLARAVGAANGRNPLSIIVPCHRVLGSTGSLTGFGGGIEAKGWLLRHEQGGWLELD